MSDKAKQAVYIICGFMLLAIGLVGSRLYLKKSDTLAFASATVFSSKLESFEGKSFGDWQVMCQAMNNNASEVHKNNAQDTEGAKRFDVANTSAVNGKVCFLYQQVVFFDSDAGKDKNVTLSSWKNLSKNNVSNAKKSDAQVLENKVIAYYKIGSFDSKNIQLVATLQPDVFITAGTAFTNKDKILFAKGIYTVCNDACYSVSNLTTNDIELIKNADSKCFMMYANSSGIQINLPFSTKGIGELLESLKM